MPFDDFGHGTHVAGLIGGGQRAADVAFQGVAPGVSFVILKVLDSTGTGKTSDVIRAIEYAVANRARLGIGVINLSLGHPPFEAPETDPLVQAVEQASAAGLIVVASAGNNGMDANGEQGYGGVSVPGNAPSALTVGAANHQDTVRRDDDRVARYSSSGPTWYQGLAKPDFVARDTGSAPRRLRAARSTEPIQSSSRAGRRARRSCSCPEPAWPLRWPPVSSGLEAVAAGTDREPREGVVAVHGDSDERR